MITKKKTTCLVASLAIMFPCFVLADSGNVVGNGINNVSTGVGNAVTDVGTGVGNAVNGASSPDNTQTAVITMSPDMSMSVDAAAAIKNLVDTKAITDGSNLNVSVTDGNATVTGTVKNQADVAIVKRAVASVKGMQNVNVDGITVDNMQTNPMSY